MAPENRLAPPCRHQVGAEPGDQHALSRVGAGGRQLAEAAHRVGHGGAQVGAQRHGTAARGASQALRQQRQRDAGKDEAGTVGESDRTAEHRQEGHHRDHGDQRRDGRRDHAEVEVVEAVDVGADAAQEVAAAVVLQPRRRQGLEVLVKPGAQPCQQPERRLVGDEALAVAAAGAQDRQRADAGGGREILDAGSPESGDGHGSDEPAGSASRPTLASTTVVLSAMPPINQLA